MIRHMRHGSPPRLMALQSILSPNRRESLPTPSAGVRIMINSGRKKQEFETAPVRITATSPADYITVTSDGAHAPGLGDETHSCGWRIDTRVRRSGRSLGLQIVENSQRSENAFAFDEFAERRPQALD